MNPFFQLLRISVSSAEIPFFSISEKEWEELFSVAQKQALTGILLEGIMKLPDPYKPPTDLLLSWYVFADKIKQYNRLLNEQTADVCDRFKQDNFQSVILKGQGNALLYPNPLLRQPGDIDIWLDSSRESIINYICQHAPVSGIVYHHADFPVLEETEVEVHFTPTWMNSYFSNKKLQTFFEQKKTTQFLNEKVLPNGRKINVPTSEVNRIFLLVHIYRHLFDEGVGLRQLVDYYYLLKQGTSEAEKQQTLHLLKKLKMKRFAAAVMYILQEVLGLEDNYLLTAPDAKAGEFLLEEIMEAGNFGHYDMRVVKAKNENRWERFLRKTKRNFRFLSYYPDEVLWSPCFKLWQYCWRRKHGYL
ncbi:MAG: nucleotidyltransferase family protein [Bacteroidaceae bacterium]|nr:nucleotidyltransferase family protein [Bacteroidaceae bacterium]